jgi:hypothetical protein
VAADHRGGADPEGVEQVRDVGVVVAAVLVGVGIDHHAAILLQRILLHIRGFKQIAHVAASHHERLDGGGYFRGLKGAEVPLGAMILSTADMFDALTAARPYRPVLPEETARRMMERDRDVAVSGACLDALDYVLERWGHGAHWGVEEQLIDDDPHGAELAAAGRDAVPADADDTDENGDHEQREAA